MAYTTITDPSVHFQTQLFTGTGSSLSVTNTGNADLQPDLVWIKNRDIVASHVLTDTTRGATKSLFSDQTSGESTETQQLTSFNSDGFTVGTSNNVNGNGNGSVAWQWKANGGTTVTNTDGATNGYNTTVQANQTAGFSIVKFNAPFDQGNGRYNLGHGLGVKPEFIITKCSGASADWYIYHKDMGGNNVYLRLNLSNATSTAANRYTFYEPAFSSTIFNMDWNNILLQNQDFICYCFAGVQGYSKFGKYTGNGDADGPFVYTGFKPAWLMIKRISGGTGWWSINDDKRNSYNLEGQLLAANENDAQYGSNPVDMLSNGFKIRVANANSDQNENNSEYIYMAFAQNPFVATNAVPTTAR